MELKGTKINFLGDSITAGDGSSALSKSFPAVIEREYGAVCRNYGICGSCIARRKEIDSTITSHRDFVMRVDDMEPDADVVVVFGGTNDFGHGDAPIGTMDDRTPYTFYGALHCLYIALIKKYPAKLIVILTPTHRYNEDNPHGDNKTTSVATLIEYVNIIREVAEYYSLPVYDLFKESGFQTRVPEVQQMLMPDGLHPSDMGYEVLAHKVAQYLKTHI